MELSGSQKKYLRGLAHHLKPTVFIGKQGVTEAVMSSLDQALNDHELIKVKFVDFKGAKKELSREIAEKSSSQLIGLIGNIAIIFRRHPDRDQRKIKLPA